MKAKKSLLMMVAALMMAAAPASLWAQQKESTDSVKQNTQTTVTVNGKTVYSSKEKAVAKQMAKQSMQMAKQGVKMAAKAVTNPEEADQIAQELEAMSQEVARLGDSLETLAEDTTFLYEGDDEDSLMLADGDVDFEEFTRDFKWNWIWPGFGGGFLGILAGIFGVLIALFVVVVLFLLFTSPIWVLALIIWLATRSSRRKNAMPYQNPPINSVASSPAQPAAAGTQAATGSQTASAQTAAGTQATGTQTAAAGMQQPRPATNVSNYVQTYPDENTEMWKSGIMYSCIGVGLIILFYSIGASSLWGVGALVACIGVAKLVIATTTKGKKQSTASAPQSDTLKTGLGDSVENNAPAATDDYNKSEN